MIGSHQLNYGRIKGIRMLVLTRNINESIRIGDDVIVTILSDNNNQVKIGIDAPESIDIHREEIYEKILSEKIENASDLN